MSLLDVGAARVLVTHGLPVLENAAAMLARALEAGPWTYRPGPRRGLRRGATGN